MGKKKDKLYKLEPETKAMIAAVRSAVEDCAATGLYGRFMGFEESHTTDDYRLTAVFDCGEYRLRLRYLPSVHRISEPEMYQESVKVSRRVRFLVSVTLL